MYALVDGGKALEKAIGLENKSRVASLNNASEISEEQDRLLAEAAEAISGAAGLDDPAKQKALEDKLKEVLAELSLTKVRCLAHITRNMGRGGGWRGPRGSLCRALLNNGVPKPIMRKVRSGQGDTIRRIWCRVRTLTFCLHS